MSRLGRSTGCWALVLLWAAAGPLARAEPAHWYQWRSRLNGQEHCAQASPGAGWDRVDGPYLDGLCKRRVKAVTL